MRSAVRASATLTIFLWGSALAAEAGEAKKTMSRAEYLVYVGTAIYSGEPSRNIYALEFDARSGKLAPLGVAGQADNPSFIAAHASGKYLYAGSAVGDVKAFTGDVVSAYSIDHSSGKLSLINSVPTHGAHPCYVTVDASGRYVLAANYWGGVVEAFPVKDSGALGEAVSVMRHTEATGPNRERQEASHPHSIILSPDNRLAVAADLGTDKLMLYRFDAKSGALTPHEPRAAAVPAGGGPRHVAFTPDGRFLFAMNELHSTVSVFSYDASTGSITLVETVSTLPPDFRGEKSGAEIHTSPSGKFLYTSNRGHDSIAVFSIDSANGRLTLIEHASTRGRTPRNFALDPTGAFMIVANQDSNNLVVFRVDSRSGRLTPTGQAVEAIAPVCVKFVPK